MAKNPKHLLGSKWTARTPVDREKHFTVVGRRATDPEDERSAEVEIEALLSRRRRWIEIQALEDESRWRRGWH